MRISTVQSWVHSIEVIQRIGLRLREQMQQPGSHLVGGGAEGLLTVWWAAYVGEAVGYGDSAVRGGVQAFGPGSIPGEGTTIQKGSVLVLLFLRRVTAWVLPPTGAHVEQGTTECRTARGYSLPRDTRRRSVLIPALRPLV